MAGLFVLFSVLFLDYYSVPMFTYIFADFLMLYIREQGVPGEGDIRSVCRYSYPEDG